MDKIGLTDDSACFYNKVCEWIVVLRRVGLWGVAVEE